jgi:hypothetical protein
VRVAAQALPGVGCRMLAAVCAVGKAAIADSAHGAYSSIARDSHCVLQCWSTHLPLSSAHCSTLQLACLSSNACMRRMVGLLSLLGFSSAVFHRGMRPALRACHRCLRACDYGIQCHSHRVACGALFSVARLLLMVSSLNVM